MIAKISAREMRKTSTPEEEMVWEILRNRKYKGIKFLRQHQIFYDLKGQTTVMITDFYSNELQLVIEIDGGYHENIKREDEERDKICELLGLRVLRIKNDLIKKDSGEFIRKLEGFIKND
ncbi:MAG: endonuclease domain-containing protein [Ignavibacteriales bacterium]|nr:endonuclease domain-containing protein [Ignavibacteriales bacterium]MCF8435821.1 endonuclease domain-containing protein [Ignavibacteriales bacterium]